MSDFKINMPEGYKEHIYQQLKGAFNSYHKGGIVPNYSTQPFNKRNEVHIAECHNGYIMEVNRGEGLKSDCLVFNSKEDLSAHISLYGLTLGKTEEERIQERGF